MKGRRAVLQEELWVFGSKRRSEENAADSVCRGDSGCVSGFFGTARKVTVGKSANRVEYGGLGGRSFEPWKKRCKRLHVSLTYQVIEESEELRKNQCHRSFEK